MSQPFHLKNGTLLLSTEAAGGMYNASQLERITAICESSGAVIKVTEDQRLALIVKETELEKITPQLEDVGLGFRHYQSGLHQPVSCIGAMCPQAKQDALGTAMQLTETLSSIDMPTGIKIGLNGCGNCCVPTHTLDFSIIGDDDGYRISIGGKASVLPELANYIAEGVPATELPNLIAKALAVFKKDAEPDETLQAMVERIGSTGLVEAFAPYSQDAMGGSLDLDTSPEDESLSIDPNGFTEDPTMGGTDINPQEFHGGTELESDIALADDEAELVFDEEPVEDSAAAEENLAVEVPVESEEIIQDDEILESDTAVSDQISTAEALEAGMEEEVVTVDDDEVASLDDEELIAEDDFIDLEDIPVEVESVTFKADSPSTESDDFIMDTVDEEPEGESIEAGEFEELTDLEVVDSNDGRLEDEIDDTAEIMMDDENEDIRNETVSLVEDSNDEIAEEDEMRDAGVIGAGSLWSLKGVNITVGNEIVLEFDTGASIQFNLATIGKARRTLSIGKATLSIHSVGNNIAIEVDGMKLTVPSKKVA